MDLIDRLSQECWKSSESSEHPEFLQYTVIRSKLLKPGHFQYAVKQLTDEGDIPHIMATLNGTCGKMNPLNGVRNCELIVKDMVITGINVDGDCVVKK